MQNLFYFSPGFEQARPDPSIPASLDFRGPVVYTGTEEHIWMIY